MVYRVLEFGSYLAGPLVGKYLADVGFHVTCVVKPSAPHEEEYMHHAWHDLRRRKTCVVLDLDRDQERIRTLVAESDVLVENLRPGVLDRAGFGHAACIAIQPSLVYLSLPAYASGDTTFEPSLPGWDSVVMASCGILGDMGLNRSLLGVEASFTELHLPSTYGSIFAALATVAALFQGTTNNERIEIPLASALAEALAHNTVEFSKDESYKSLRQIAIEQGRGPLTPEELERLVDPFFSKYLCADDRPVYLVCPSHWKHQLNAIDCLGVEEEVRRLLPYPASLYEEGHEMYGIGSGRLTQEQADAVRPILENAFRNRPSYEWETRLGRSQVPIVAHRSTREWIEDHAKKSGLYETGGFVGPLVWHHDEGRNTFDNYEHQTLSDVTVLDLTNVIAGPTIGSMLARFGANVVKVDPTLPVYAPSITVVYGLVANVGKRSVLMDITRPGGCRALHKLIQKSDIVIINSTDDASRRLGLTPDDIRSVNPDTLLVRFDAWGGPLETGPLKDFVGYDDNVQAGIGIMERFGGGLDTVEEHAHVGTIDVIAGVAGAFAAVVALLHRKKTGRVVTARTSLAAVGQYLQYLYMFERSFPTIGRGVSCIGFHRLHRHYRTRDGETVLVAGCLTHDPIVHHALCPEDLEVIVGKRTADEACAWLAKHGIGHSRVLRLRDVVSKFITLRFSPHGPSFQYLRHTEHPIGPVVQCAPVAIRWCGVRTELEHAPQYGTHTLEILESIHEAKLVLQRVASTGWSRNYLPFTLVCEACGDAATGVVTLQCNHTICRTCLNRLRNMEQVCVVCGEPHTLDLFELRIMAFTFGRQYRDWRRGLPKGSRDLHRLFHPRHSLLHRSRSDPGIFPTSLLNTFDTSLTSRRSSCVNLSNKGWNATQAADLSMPRNTDP